MDDDPSPTSAVIEEATLLAQLQLAWHESGVGSLDGPAGYVQWAKYSEGLQIEVGSITCSPHEQSLDFSARRQLELLGFTQPDQSQPNYHRRFLTYDSLQEAARVLASVLRPPVQPQGHVMVVVPAGKVVPDLLGELIRRVFWALHDRVPVTMIDAYGLEGGHEQTGEPIDQYLDRRVPEPSDRASVLRATLATDDRAQWHAHGQKVVAAAIRLRAEGRHVVVVGPHFLPRDEAAWVDLLRQCADGVLLIGSHYELATFMAKAVDAVELAAPPGVVRIMGHHNLHTPASPRPVPAHHFDLGVIDVPAEDIDGRIFSPLAQVMGIPWLAGGGGGGERLETPLPWPMPHQAAETTTTARSVVEAPGVELGDSPVPGLLAFANTTDFAHAWQPLVEGSALSAVCDALRDEPLHIGAGPSHDDLARPFALAIHAKSQLLQVSLSPRQRAAVLASISVDIRKYCDVASPDFLVPRVSASSSAAARHLGVDLCQQVWQDQPSFDPGRTVFHLEHVVPVQSLRNNCLSATDEAGALRALKGAQVAWILKSEDRELTRLGFRSSRTSPEQAYEVAGIELLECPHSAGSRAITDRYITC